MSITAERKPGEGDQDWMVRTYPTGWRKLSSAYSRVSPIERYTPEEEDEEAEGRTEYAEFKMLGKVRHCQRKRQK